MICQQKKILRAKNGLISDYVMVIQGKKIICKIFDFFEMYQVHILILPLRIRNYCKKFDETLFKNFKIAWQQLVTLMRNLSDCITDLKRCDGNPIKTIRHCDI